MYVCVRGCMSVWEELTFASTIEADADLVADERLKVEHRLFSSTLQ